MVHNGIEYAHDAGLRRGLRDPPGLGPFELDLHQLAQLWNQGSVVRSWLLELAERAFAEDPGLSKITRLRRRLRRGPLDGAGGDRRGACRRRSSPSPLRPLPSRQDDSFAMKVLAALRNEFGGHPVKTQ